MLDQIQRHVSIRKYKNQPIPEDLLQKILNCGTRAASSSNFQFYSVVVTKNPELKERLYEAHHSQKMVLEAPVVLTFCCDLHRIDQWMKDQEAPSEWNNWISFLRGAVDACLVAQNMALAAENSGLGICYMGSTLMGTKQIIETLQLPKLVFPITSMVMGYPDESPDLRDRLPLEGVVHQETYSPFTHEKIKAVYNERNQKYWERFSQNSKSAEIIEKEKIQNVAQFYAKTKQKKEDLAKYSDDLIELFWSQFDLFVQR